MSACLATWRAATEQALYGPQGFYRSSGAAARHFRTSVHAADAYAAAVLELLRWVDAELGHPPRLDIVDVGAGQAELLCRVLGLTDRELAARLRPLAVERAPRPAGLPARIEWSDRLPERITGLAIGNEWLDNIGVDVVVHTEFGTKLLLVDPATGHEQPAGFPDAADARWLERWWPLDILGARAEIGRPRDEAWADLLGRIDRGVAVAVDYAHERACRPVGGTLAGYLRGRQVVAVPDGSRDVTASVALDACAAAGVTAGADATLLLSQRDALRALGVSGRRPDIGLASSDPAAYLTRLRQAGEEGELLDPSGLGGFSWLLQSVQVSLDRTVHIG